MPAAAYAASSLAQRSIDLGIAVGEESGSLDQMSGKVVGYYEAEVDNSVDAMSSLPSWWCSACWSAAS
jgi:type IV pilus assembly protein PilC